MLLDHEYWKHWEGQRIDAKFTLDRMTRGDGPHATFETKHRDRPALVHFFAGDNDDIAARRQRWRESAGLSHEALVEVYHRGEVAIGEVRCAYIVTERPDDYLEDVLRHRPLNPEETREMLTPLLGVVAYLHARGFAHGELKPANIMGFGEQLKLSSHSLIPNGDIAADCIAIGQLLKTVGGADAFANIVKGSAEGWSAARMQGALRGSPRNWWLAGAAAAVAAGAFVFWPSTTPTPETPVVNPAPERAPAASKQKPAANAASKPSPSIPASAPPPKPAPAKSVAVQNLDGITQVMPDIPQKARGTITGRVRINVRVSVDGEGRVTQATLDPPAASPYFTSRALTASRAWKFPKGQPVSEYVLRYELRRADTSVSVAKVR
jgi:hypothetical protein